MKNLSLTGFTHHTKSKYVLFDFGFVHCEARIAVNLVMSFGCMYEDPSAQSSFIITKYGPVVGCFA